MFDFEEFYFCESYEEKINYAKKSLEPLAFGSYRSVFSLDDNNVIKIANNEDGLIRNNVEKYFSETNWDFLAKVNDFDDDFMWIVSEKAKPLNQENFEKISEISLNDFYSYIHARTIMLSLKKTMDQYESIGLEKKIVELEKIPFVKKIVEKSEEFNFKTQDIASIKNFGILIRNNKEELGLINYGYFDTKFRKIKKL